MEYLTHPEQLAAIDSPLYLAIGTFDGIHLGHKRVIQNAVHQATLRAGGRSGVITFHPHPLEILAPQHAPVALAAPSQRLPLFAAQGVDFVLDFAFSREFAMQTPAEFVDNLLRQCPRLEGITVGSDWKFGRDRAGTVALLREIGQCQGFRVDSISTVMVQGCAVKSTRIRNIVREGDLAKAHFLLGRPYPVQGRVVRGRQLGKKLGFPTANLAVENQLLPPPGVMLVEVRIEGDPAWKTLPGVANLGHRPTIEPKVADQHPPLLEVHILDWSGDLYGRKLEVALIHRLRAEQKFSGIDELVSQVHRDRESARHLYTRLLAEGFTALAQEPSQAVLT